MAFSLNDSFFFFWFREQGAFFSKQSRTDEGAGGGSRGLYWRVRPDAYEALEAAIRLHQAALDTFSAQHGGPRKKAPLQHQRRSGAARRAPASELPLTLDPALGANMLLAMTQHAMAESPPGCCYPIHDLSCSGEQRLINFIFSFSFSFSFSALRIGVLPRLVRPHPAMQLAQR
jgi:hypothetical protein